jgi:hypothetical protein
MKRFYVMEDLTGRRVYLGDVEVSPLLAGHELSGNPFEPDRSFENRSPLAKNMPVSFDINPKFF